MMDIAIAHGTSGPRRSAVLLADPLPSAASFEAAARQAGYDVHRAGTLDEARCIAETVRPGLAVIELKIGQESGIDLIADLRRLVPDVRAVIVTVFGSVESARAALRSGAVGYLTKPTFPYEVLAALGESGAPRSQSCSVEEVRAAYIREVLSYCGSIAQASRALSVDRRSLRRMMVRFGLR